MRILSLVLGTRGDLEIALQLSTALAARGHAMTVASSPFYADRVAEAGFAFRPVGDGRLDDLLDLFRELSHVRDRSERIRLYAERWLKPQLAGAQRQISGLLADFDTAFNNLRLFDRASAARPMTLITYDPPSDPSRYGRQAPPPHVLEVVALDRGLVDPHGEWPEHFRFSGFFKPDYAGTSPPAAQAELLDGFLGRGDAPVVLTMGSMTCADPEALRGAVLAACRRVGRRLLTISSWSAVPDCVEDDSLTIRQAPYDRVFAAAACVIHHGGCGTVVSALRAGKPSILLPQITSQVTFGKLLERQGLSGGSFDADALDPSELADAMERCLGNPEIAGACSVWRKRLLEQDGAQAAAEMIELHADQFGRKG